MPFEYKCKSCQAIGDLDSFVNQIECPNCGGMMTPLISPQPATTAIPSDEIVDGETPTTIVPRTEILKEMGITANQPKKVVKVAKIVNIGFGGMLTTSATRGFKPITPGKKDSGLPFSQQSSFPQQTEKTAAPPAKEPTEENGQQSTQKPVASSSTSLGGQRKKTFTVSKSKTPASPMLQTSTQYMDATQIDPRIAAANQQKAQQTAPPATAPQQENPQAPQDILPKPRIGGQTSTSLKFLPKGALKVAQTHTSIQRSQLPPPPQKTQTKIQPPVQPQQHMPRQYEQPPSPPPSPDQYEDFAAQVRVEAERQEAIIREAYRIADEKIRKEREEIEKISKEEKARKGEKETAQAGKDTENTELTAMESAKMLAAQIAKELAETEELIIKERQTLELRKKELEEIRKKMEEETVKAKFVQENKIVLLTPQKPVKLKSSEGSDNLMRSSKNLQIDKKIFETGKQVLKEELEKKEFKAEGIGAGIAELKKDDAAVKKSTLRGLQPASPLNKKGLQTPLFTSEPPGTTSLPANIDKEKSPAAIIGEALQKGKTPTKLGITPDAPFTNSTLVKMQKKKKTIIFSIVGVAVLLACLLIFFVGGKIVRMIKSSFSPSTVAVPSVPAPDKLQNSINPGSSLQADYNAVFQKIKKTPANKQEIDDNIKEWQDFIDRYPNAPDTDNCIKGAKTHIKNMKDMKELY